MTALSNQNALVWISSEVNQTRTFTYAQLFEEVNRCAHALNRLGVGKGDRVLIYMPMVPEAVFAMLATVRLGAIHSVVFGHSHVYEYKKWGSRKEYFNTGTWTELTSLDLTSLGKITKLTYVLFEYSDADSGPHGRLKEWRGFHRIEEDIVVA